MFVKSLGNMHSKVKWQLK